MPTITKYRTWCDHCKKWTLNSSKGYEWICDECGTEHQLYCLDNIPEYEIAIQRKRYKSSKVSRLLSAYDKLCFSMDNYSNYSNLEIVEADAGQRKIDDLLKEEFNKRLKEKQELKDLYNEKYKGVNRNGNCPCGKLGEDGKPMKYKKCCLNKFRYI